MDQAYKVRFTNWKDGSGKDERYFINFADASNYLKNYERFGYEGVIETIYFQEVQERVG